MFASYARKGGLPVKNQIIIGSGLDPWKNLAMEERLFDSCRGQAILYLWQNRNTVVIGRNQNAWAECRTALLEREGGRLARRSSGGGAVYHDTGNLNFTLILPRAAYDVPRQLGVVAAAVETFGIAVEMSGRNDLVLREDGAKCSGSAFRFSEHTAMHHGTLLVDVDMDKLSRYLSPPPDKLLAKGVKSVRARVRNLCDCAASITIDSLCGALCTAFCREYGEAERLSEAGFAGEALTALEEKYASWDWRYGKTPAFTAEYSTRFPWGGVSLLLNAQDGIITQAQCYSDAMDEAMIQAVAPALIGAPCNGGAMADRLATLTGTEAAGLRAWIRSHCFSG